MAEFRKRLEQIDGKQGSKLRQESKLKTQVFKQQWKQGHNRIRPEDFPSFDDDIADHPEYRIGEYS